VSAGLEALEVRIGLGSCGIANGAEPVWRALRQAAREAGREQLIKAVGCGGSCHREPLVEVIGGGGQRAVYTHVTAEVAPLILRRHLRPGRWGRRLGWTLRRLRDPEEPLPADGVRALGQRIVLENCGEIDPRSIEEYRQRGGYEQLERCLVSLGPEQVIEVVNAADLRGRGGAGFPTARKWELARQQPTPIGWSKGSPSRPSPWAPRRGSSTSAPNTRWRCGESARRSSRPGKQASSAPTSVAPECG
jgi:NADH-quinone oxidoreductase subunit F